jgi:hypothetical protein
MAGTTIKHRSVGARSRVACALIAAQLVFWCAASLAGLESNHGSGFAPLFVTARGDPGCLSKGCGRSKS